MRHPAQEQTGADESRPHLVMREPEQNRADQSIPEHIHRSLDHVIGVQIPASQPAQALSLKNLQYLAIPRRSPVLAPRARPRLRFLQAIDIDGLSDASGHTRRL